jgi:formate hydrogenlyase subunit 3/multisubunit Na+/H+ antiporter MnhD subunit
LWIFVPIIGSILLVFVRKWFFLTTSISLFIAFILASAAWFFPVGEQVTLGPLTINIETTLIILGRAFSILEKDQGIISLIYFMAAFWFGGCLVSKPGNLAAPFGLGVIGLLVAALVVEPFIFAALFIELAVLLSIPILSQPGNRVGNGVLRYMSFQTLGIPFILFTGWMLTGIDTNPIDISLAIRPVVLMGFGFALLLAVFPFHTWLPMLAEEVSPYVSAFIFLFLPGIVSVFGLSFFERYAWLRNSPSVFGMLRAVGFLMVITGGIWAAFESHQGRKLGFAAIVENGLSLMAVGIGVDIGVRIFFALLLPRCIGYLFWAIAMSEIKSIFGDLEVWNIKGIGYKYPFLVGGLVLSQLSVAGFPILAGFPPRMALLEQISVGYPLMSAGVLMGFFGVFAGGIRTLAVSISLPGVDQENDGETNSVETPKESLGKKILYSYAIVLLFLFGLFPQLYTPILARLPQAFEQLLP